MVEIQRIEPRRVRVAEVGFRTQEVPAGAVEPAAYEWNTRHDTGRYRPVLDESLMLTGDENLVEVYGVAHYSVADPAAYLLAARDAARAGAGDRRDLAALDGGAAAARRRPHQRAPRPSNRRGRRR